MTRKPLAFAVRILLLSLFAFAGVASAERLPNVILIVADDLGYADVGVYGAKGFDTPHLDRLAHEGIRFTDFHVAQAVCSASRAAIMTGCYPNRIGIEGAMEPWYKFDGLTWTQNDVRPDQLHPNESGSKKTTTLLLNFFKTNEGASRWFVKPGEKAQAAALPK